MQYALSLRYARLAAMHPISSSPCRVPLYYFSVSGGCFPLLQVGRFSCFHSQVSSSQKRTVHQVPPTSYQNHVDQIISKTTKKNLIMEKSFFNMDDSIDSENSFLNIPGTPGRAGSDFSYYGDNDTSLFSQGDQSPPPFPMTPGPSASQSSVKRKNPEEKMTPGEMMPPSPVFLTPGQVKKKKKLEEKRTPETALPVSSSFSSTATTPRMKAPAIANFSKAERKDVVTTTTKDGITKKPVQVEPVQENQQIFAAPATPPTPEKKESLTTMKEEDRPKEISPSLSMLGMMETQLKELKASLLALESHQVEGGNRLLARAADIKEEVTTYQDHLEDVKEHYRERIAYAASCFARTAK